ncbi:MAG: AEC family transporter [Clostridia bacterium]|nr:AEC family transporter [Clostridia bacterium]
MDFMLSFRVVLPLCIYIGIGIAARAGQLITPSASSVMSRFIFRMLFPLLMFENVMNAGAALHSDGIGIVWFLFAAVTAVFILLMLFIPCFEKSRPRQASMIQAGFRSNSVLFALPIASALCGSENLGIVSVCVAVCVPWYNVLSVIALESRRGEQIRIGKLARGIVTNPLILGALAGGIALLLNIRLPEMLSVPLHTLTSMVTPLALILLGADLQFRGLRKDWRMVVLTSFIKLILVPLLITGGAWLLGFRGLPLISVFSITCVPPAVSSYTMAVEMGADGPLAGEILAFATVVSIVTIFLWVSLLSAGGILA